MYRKLFIVLLLSGLVQAANIFEYDPNCIVHWDFESSNIVLDGQGNYNLTNNGASNDTVTYRTGTSSAFLVYSQSDYLYRNTFIGAGTDANTFSITCWVNFIDKPDTGENCEIVSEYDSVANNRDWNLYYYGTGTVWKVDWGNIGGTVGNNVLSVSAEPNEGEWYFVALTYDATDNGIVLRVYDDNGDLFLTDSDTTANDLNREAAYMVLGGRMSNGSRVTNCRDSVDLDEFCVFNKELTAGDIGEIMAGTYDTGYTSQPTQAVWYVYVGATGSQDGTSLIDAFEDLGQMYAWANDSNDPITRNEYWDVYLSGLTADSNTPIVWDVPTDVSHYIRFHGNKTTSGWDATKYRLTGADCMVMTVDSNYVSFDNMQWQCTSEDGAGDGCLTITTPGVPTTNIVTLTRCIFRGDGIYDQDEIAVTAIDPNTVLFWNNSVVYDVNDGVDLLANCKIVLPDSSPIGDNLLKLGGLLQE